MRRREFIAGLGGVAAWPFSARGQQPGIPVIGYLSTTSAEAAKGFVADFRRGLRDAGYVEGQNVAIEFRWGNGQPLMRQLASDLVHLQVAVIVAAGASASQFAAKAATSTIPIVMAGGVDPVKSGLVPSLSRPGGNITGVTYITNELADKQLDLLIKIAPEATTVGYLVGNQTSQQDRETTDELLKAAQTLGRQIIVLECRDVSDFEKAFATMIERRAGAVVVGAFPLFFTNRSKIVALAARHKIPAVYAQPQYVIEGGLMSYGAARVYHQVAIRYVARILKGAKPADLPIEQPTNFSLVINSKTAKALGLEIPPMLFVQADRVIE
jgi:putative tryptophan/tyrosine transport system substrate-binding protein